MDQRLQVSLVLSNRNLLVWIGWCKNKHFLSQYFTVHLTGKYKGREFDDREVTFVLGETDEEEVILGIQEALIYFGKGEVSRLVKPFFSYVSIELNFY